MTTTSSARRLAAALAVAFATLLTITASAHAAGAIGIVEDHPQLNADVLEFGGDGAADSISIYYEGTGTPKFTYSAGVDVQAVAPCTATTSSTGECPSAGITYVVAFGGGGNDLINLDMCGLCGTSPSGLIFGEAGDDKLDGAAATGSGPSSASYGIRGGEGNDTLESGNGADTLLGEAGNDVLEASDGADTVDGGAGDDSLSAESLQDAADVYIGGDGFDSIGGNVSTGNDFSEPNTDIGVSLDGVANDGEPGEGDNVMPDVERVKALGRHVTLIGSDAANELIATGNSSTIRGLGGDDRLIGADGADSLEGGEGADYLEGGFGPDVLDGGGGVDQFVGDKTERDVIASGNDTIRARDGLAEQINCGIGSDSAIVDLADVVDPSCEAVDRGAVLLRPRGSRASPRSSASCRSGRSPPRASRSEVRCPAACTVTAELRVNKRTARKLRLGRSRVLARGRGTAAAAGNAKVTLKVTGKTRKRFKRMRKAKVTLRTTTTIGPTATPATVALKLKR